MTNETTASQPKVAAPDEDRMDAMRELVSDFRKAAFEFGQALNPDDHALMMRLQQQLFIELRAMPSQPNSIGDDAHTAFDRFANLPAKPGAPIWHAFHAGVEWERSRAPAAQASATIQAAPDLSKLPVHYVEGLENGGYYLCTDVIRALAATTQEPVMVAEPDDSQWVDRCSYDAQVDEWAIERSNFEAEIELLKSAAPMVADPVGVALTVWCGAMPESNGRSNFTALLMRKGGDMVDGITLDRSEYPDRVRYEADRVRYLLGELTEPPFILDYDADKHSGYVPPAATVKAVPSEALDEAAAYRMWRECEISEDSWFMQHLADYLPAECRQRAPTAAEWDAAMARIMQDRAPLADKTGGGE